MRYLFPYYSNTYSNPYSTAAVGLSLILSLTACGLGKHESIGKRTLKDKIHENADADVSVQKNAGEGRIQETPPTVAPPSIKSPGLSLINFEDHVKPLMDLHCLSCHVNQMNEVALINEMPTFQDPIVDAYTKTEKWRLVLQQTTLGLMPPGTNADDPDILTFSQTLEQWIDAGLPNNKEEAESFAENTAQTNPAPTPPSPNKPPNPLGLFSAENLATSAGGTDMVQLDWECKNTPAAVAHYEIFRDGLYIGQSTIKSFTDEAGQLQPGVPALSANTAYSYHVVVVGINGQKTQPSATAQVTTLTVVDSTAPSTPLDAAASVENMIDIVISWSQSIDDLSGVRFYLIFLNGVEAARTDQLTHTLTGLQPNSNYEILVYAEDNAGNRSQASSPVTLETDPLVVDGVALYASNCSSCHKSIAVSDKTGKNANEIQNSITNVPRMQALSFLSPTEVAAIADALAPTVASQPPDPFTCEGTKPVSRPNPLRRLTYIEFSNTMASVFGREVFNLLAINVGQYPKENFQSIGQFNNNVLDGHFKAQWSTAEAFAKLFVEDGSEIQSFKTIYGITCSWNNKNTACVEEIVNNFGKYLFRRPITQADVTKFVALYNQVVDSKMAMETVMLAMVSSPEVILHGEYGAATVPSAPGGSISLTQFEIANRISYMTADSPPDQILIDAAALNQLISSDKIRSQVVRILESTGLNNNLIRFGKYWANLRDLPSLEFFPEFLDGIDSKGLVNGKTLKEEMLAEFENFISHTFLDDASHFKDLFLSQASFPESARMKEILDTKTNWQPGAAPVQAPGHYGVTQRPAFLAGSHANDSSSIILRGVDIRQKLLCDDVDPPVDIDLQQGGNLLDRATVSNREFVTSQTAGAACAGCHQYMNPLGFALETFDALGRIRSLEKVFDSSHQLIASHSINTVVAPEIGIGEATEIANASEFATLLANHPKTAGCFTRKMYQFVTLKLEDENGKADGCQLKATRDQFVGAGNSIKAVFIDFVVSQALLEKKL